MKVEKSSTGLLFICVFFFFFFFLLEPVDDIGCLFSKENAETFSLLAFGYVWSNCRDDKALNIDL